MTDPKIAAKFQPVVKSTLPPILLLAVLAFVVACATGSSERYADDLPVPERSTPEYRYYRTLALEKEMIPYGRYGRFANREMDAKYITVHSTANLDATARNHADALRNGKLSVNPRGLNRTGYLTWHFSVDDIAAFQHLPTGEQGEHADYSGPGNLTSIGVEICEFRNPARQAAAIDRAARLVAWVMEAEDIPLKRVVPHYHWPRWPNNWHKPCPRIFMEGEHPGPQWDAFRRRIQYYHRYLEKPDTMLAFQGAADAASRAARVGESPADEPLDLRASWRNLIPTRWGRPLGALAHLSPWRKINPALMISRPGRGYELALCDLSSSAASSPLACFASFAHRRHPP